MRQFKRCQSGERASWLFPFKRLFILNKLTLTSCQDPADWWNIIYIQSCLKKQTRNQTSPLGGRATEGRKGEEDITGIGEHKYLQSNVYKCSWSFSWNAIMPAIEFIGQIEFGLL